MAENRYDIYLNDVYSLGITLIMMKNIDVKKLNLNELNEEESMLRLKAILQKETEKDSKLKWFEEMIIKMLQY